MGYDPGSFVPAYEQVRTQVAAAIASGEVAPSERLPPIRQLAADLGLAVNTVARAYRGLEVEGLVESRGARGTFVPDSPTEVRPEAGRIARDFATRMRKLGIGPSEIVAILREELRHESPRRVAPNR